MDTLRKPTTLPGSALASLWSLDRTASVRNKRRLLSPVMFLLAACLLFGCASTKTTHKDHPSLAGTWVLTGTTGKPQNFVSGSPDLSLNLADLDNDDIQLVFSDQTCTMLINGKKHQETIYTVKATGDDFQLDLSAHVSLKNESVPTLTSYGSMPIIWKSNNHVVLSHNNLGDVDFQRRTGTRPTTP